MIPLQFSLALDKTLSLSSDATKELLGNLVAIVLTGCAAPQPNSMTFDLFLAKHSRFEIKEVTTLLC